MDDIADLVEEWCWWVGWCIITEFSMRTAERFLRERKWCSLQVVQWDCKHNSPSMRTDSCGNVSVDQDWLNIEQDHEYLLGFDKKLALIYHVPCRNSVARECAPLPPAPPMASTAVCQV